MQNNDLCSLNNVQISKFTVEQYKTSILQQPNQQTPITCNCSLKPVKLS